MLSTSGCRPFLFFVLLVAAVLAPLLIPAPSRAWDAKVHPKLNRLGAALVQKSDPAGVYWEIYLPLHVDKLDEGGLDEDENYIRNGNAAAYNEHGNCDATDGEGTFAPQVDEGYSDDKVPGDSHERTWREIAFPRSRKHFYHPPTGKGVSDRITARELVQGRCMDAASWARNDQGEGLTWTGAIEAYGYTVESKKAGYFRVGHVGHLIGDMAQPDHVHLEPHNTEGVVQSLPGGEQVAAVTGSSLDKFAENNWVSVAPNVDTLIPKRFTWLEPHLTELARITYKMSKYHGGTLLKQDDGGVDFRTDLARMISVAWDPEFEDDWKMYNKQYLGGGHVGDWDGALSDEDEWYETFQETYEAPYENGEYPRGYYFIERNERTLPARLQTVIRTGDEYVLGWIENDSIRLERHLAQTLLPLAVEHIAGMYMHFYDVVNHPPILAGVRVEQGKCVYEKIWNPVLDAPPLARIRKITPTFWPVSERVLADSCTTEASRRWINGVDGPSRITLRFGADYGLVHFTTVASDTPFVPDGWVDIRVDDVPKPMRLVSVHIGGLEVPGTLAAGNTLWTTLFDPPADGSLDGDHVVMAVTGDDRSPHFTGNTDAPDDFITRNYSGDDLDREPGSLARAQSVDPYNWEGYRPGADVNHAIMIDVTPPTMALVRAGVDDQNRTVAVYEVSDATSGVDFINVPVALNATVAVDPFTPGDKRVLVTITVADRDHSAQVTLATEDVAGNPYDPSVVIPVIGIKRGPSLPPINPKSRGLTPVAVFADDDFDPADLDLSTIVFGPGMASPHLPGHKNPKNPHGNPDMMLHFSTQEAAIQPGDRDACLSGRTEDDAFVISCQWLRIVGTGKNVAANARPAPSVELAAVSGTPDGVALEIRVVRAGPGSGALDAGAGDPGALSTTEVVDIHRGMDPDPSRAEHVGSVPAPGNASVVSWHDAATTGDAGYLYWAVLMNEEGPAVLTGPVSLSSLDRQKDVIAGDLPVMNRLLSPLPNPSSGSVVFRYGAVGDAVVSLKIFDVRGRLIARVMENEAVASGWREARWTGRDTGGTAVVSGVYYAQLIVNGVRAGEARRFIVTR